MVKEEQVVLPLKLSINYSGEYYKHLINAYKNKCESQKKKLSRDKLYDWLIITIFVESYYQDCFQKICSEFGEYIHNRFEETFKRVFVFLENSIYRYEGSNDKYLWDSKNSPKYKAKN